MAKRYDPMKPPRRDEWLSLSQSGHITRVLEYHRLADPNSTDMAAHAALHVAIENQLIAPGGGVVRKTLDRLLERGMDRHTALHAIGDVYRRFEDGTVQKPHPDAIDWAAYESALRKLVASSGDAV